MRGRSVRESRERDIQWTYSRVCLELSDGSVSRTPELGIVKRSTTLPVKGDDISRLDEVGVGSYDCRGGLVEVPLKNSFVIPVSRSSHTTEYRY